MKFAHWTFFWRPQCVSGINIVKEAQCAAFRNYLRKKYVFNFLEIYRAFTKDLNLNNFKVKTCSKLKYYMYNIKILCIWKMPKEQVCAIKPRLLKFLCLHTSKLKNIEFSKIFWSLNSFQIRKTTDTSFRKKLQTSQKNEKIAKNRNFWISIGFMSRCLKIVGMGYRACRNTNSWKK